MSESDVLDNTLDILAERDKEIRRLNVQLAAAEKALEAARWLDYLWHGVGKAGSAPEDGEWDSAYVALHAALAEYDALRK